MPKVETIIKDAHFTFDQNCGLAIYINCDVIGEKNKGASWYITDLTQLNQIREILNKNKTGYSKFTFDQEDLNKLVGFKAVFYEEDNNQETIHFKYILGYSKELND